MSERRPSPRLPRLGLRRETLILLPVALLLLVLLSLFTLAAHRSGLELLAEERREETLAAAREFARRAAGTAAPGAPRPDLTSPRRRIAVVDADGRAVGRGEAPQAIPRTPPTGEGVSGPGPAQGDAVIAFAPFERDGRRLWVRLDQPAPVLATQLERARLLGWVVLGTDLALAVLVLLFVGHLLRPWDDLLEHARRAGVVGDPDQDEVDLVLATFESALEALAGSRPEGDGGDGPADDPDGEELALLGRTLPSSFDSGVLLLDPRGRALALNALGGRLLDLDPEAVTGHPAAAELLADHPRLARLVVKAVDGEPARRRQVELGPAMRGPEAEDGGDEHRTDPVPPTLGVTVHPLRRDDGTRRGFLVLFADLTEVRRRAREERLAENLRHLGEMASGVAHELRNSLAAAKGWLALLERRLDAGNSPGELLDELGHEMGHLHRVLEDFLSFARPGSVRPRPLSLAAVVERAAADPVLADAAVQVETALAADGDDRMIGDPQLLERALRNLLHNAHQAQGASGNRTADDRVRQTSGSEGDPGATIRVRLDATDDPLVVTIADRGPGLPEAVRRRLFHPFTSGRADGVGLGLALARRIVRLHGGDLSLDDRPGGGTVARLALPRGTPDAATGDDGDGGDRPDDPRATAP